MFADEAPVSVGGGRETGKPASLPLCDLNALSALFLLDLAPGIPEIGVPVTPLEAQGFACQRMLNSVLTKYEHANSADADKAAFEKFLAVNKRCEGWSLQIESDEDAELIGTLKDVIWKFCYPRQAGTGVLSSFGQILAEGKTGPGSSLGANANDFYTKMFASQLTYTSEGLYKAYRHYVGALGHAWQDAEMNRYSAFGLLDRVVQCNRLAFVPKKVETSRCIAIEPSLNMFYQLGIKALLERRLRSFFGIDVALQQEKNRELARVGSLTGQYSTIDLSSASDSLSLKMMRSILPPEIMGFLEAVRSPKMEIPPDLGGGELELHMVSTMGNGSTFSLLSLVCSSIVVAAHRVAEVPVEFPRGLRLGNFGIVGDDIICETKVTRLVLRLLALLGFSVNSEKSFVRGPFRESCGGDFFQGVDVKPVYIKRLESPQDLYVALNQLNRWTAKTGVSLPLSAAFLRSFLPREQFLVPLAEQDDAGLKVPYDMVVNLKRCKFTQAVKYSRWEARQSKVHATMCGIYSRTASGGWEDAGHFNPHGLWLAFLRGDVRGGCFSRRHTRVAYRIGKNVCSSWDASPKVLGHVRDWPFASQPVGDVWQFGTAYEANTVAYTELCARELK